MFVFGANDCEAKTHPVHSADYEALGGDLIGIGSIWISLPPILRICCVGRYLPTAMSSFPGT